MKNIDESLAAFEIYKSRYETYLSEDLTESDTRSKLIDFLLIDVLGWQEEDIRREGHVDSGYFDYLVSVPGLFFIVEAKRQFREFSLPTNHKQTSLNSLLKGNKEHIDQIRKYCFDESIPYGLITNGLQFVLLKSYNSDNTPWKENVCLLFNGVDDIQSRFIEFYDNLSKRSIICNGGFKYDLPISNIISKTILSSLIDRDKELVRNKISSDISFVIDRVFGEIFSEEREDDEEFIKYCFVENRETKKNKSEIERLFSDTAPRTKGVVPAINTESISTQILSEINSDDIAISNNYPPKPIVIIGSKGAGKTTFINHLFKYKLSDNDLQDNLLVYIDFRKLFESSTTIDHGVIVSEVLEKMYSSYEHLQLHSYKVLIRVYYKDIKRNDQSIWQWDRQNDQPAYNKSVSTFLKECTSNPIRHLEYVSKYLIRERRKRLIVIIDNADQFKDIIQEDLFRFAHSLTKSALCGTVISLREGYYNKWQNSPPFDAYESNVYHITAPNYAEILQKRIDFALDKTDLPSSARIKGNDDKGFKLDFSAQEINHFLSGLKNSIFSEENADIIDFLNHTTYPNLREGLRIFKSFLTSGHTKVSDYILREKFRIEQSEEERRVIPMHEFVKSISLQNRHYYNAEISSLYNLFIPPVDSSDHFLKIYILTELKDLIERKNYTEKLVPNNLVVEKFNSLGYRITSINSAISSLIEKALVDTDEHLSDVIWTELPSRFNLCITAKGHYYLTELVNKFQYWDLIIQDTPIFDMTSFDEIRHAFPYSDDSGLRNLMDRVATVQLFLNYLFKREANQPAQVKLVFGSVVQPIVSAVDAQIAFIKSRLNKTTRK